ncbi:MAG TPA: KpsF/GutQ family sugar-phosphate isomerase [Ramlibacter sp.]|jgi:arabinose-5-phosphate isomerase
MTSAERSAAYRVSTLFPDRLVGVFRNVFEAQAEELLKVGRRAGQECERAAELILSIRGRTVVCGMGKSGIVGKKIAATLASTGTPSFFVHPAEAFHGDLGMITSDDVVVLISYSGETDEVLRLLPYLQHVGAQIIALTGVLKSTLARNAHVVLDVGIEKEACPNNLAPTTSTTATLVMGDAIAVALMHLRGFRAQDFARFHPGGSLGRKLLTRVRDVMHDRYPTVTRDAGFKAVVSAISRGRLGIALVVDGDGMLAGVITDGDLGRAMEAHDDTRHLCAADMMSRRPFTISQEAMFSEAEEIMNRHTVTALVAVDGSGAPAGVLKIFDVHG